MPTENENIFPPSLLDVHNGQEAEAHSHPWLLRLMIGEKFHCGASLISISDHLNESDIAITAAHCVDR